jgi:tRNA (cytidine56-2'-O)-methyltransferase
VGTGSNGSVRRPPRRPRRPNVSVLRVGHRAGRDPRLTTHVALTARALGAERLYLHPPDPALAERLSAVGRRWGGTFEVLGAPDWRKVVRSFEGSVVHLTMYGEPLDDAIGGIRRAERVLVVVGGAKVPADLYRLSTVNVAVGHQPHSEVAALALILDRLVGVPGPGRWRGAAQEIVPSRRGKTVRTHSVGRSTT